MAYEVNQGAVCSITLMGKHEGQEVLTVLHYRLLIDAPAEDGRLLLDRFMTQLNLADALVDDWRECLSVKCSNLRFRGQWITPLRYAFIERTTAPGDGEVEGDAYPVNTAVAITRRTELSGRDQLGTIHMPAVPISFMENGALTETAGLAYAGLGEELIKEVVEPDSNATFLPILFGTGNPDFAQPLVGYSVGPEARVMRRRTVGLGT